MLSTADLRRLCDLARFEVPSDGGAALQQDVTRVLDWVAQLAQADTTGVAPLSHPGDPSLRLRDDRVTEADQHEAFQQAAPAVEDGLYLVPRVIE
jgi:aspartyl-tRNA(Asn)/glutamyl-tRNA(Gln) amidotransferase subunit C